MMACAKSFPRLFLHRSFPGNAMKPAIALFSLSMLAAVPQQAAARGAEPVAL
jgi:hypothetical protein